MDESKHQYILKYHCKMLPSQGEKLLLYSWIYGIPRVSSIKGGLNTLVLIIFIPSITKISDEDLEISAHHIQYH